MHIGATPGLTDPKVAFRPYAEQIEKCFELLDAGDRHKLMSLSQHMASHVHAHGSSTMRGVPDLYETLMSTKIFLLQPEDITTLDLVELLEGTFGRIQEYLKGEDRIWLYIDWAMVKNPRLLAAVFYLSGLTPEYDGWLTTRSIRENVACIAFEGGERLAELVVELSHIEGAKRRKLVNQLPKMGRDFHHYRMDSRKLEIIERHGGVTGLLEKGVDGLQFCESLVSDLDHANLRHFVKMHKMLGALIAQLKFEDKICEGKIHKLMTRALHKLVKTLGKHANGGRHIKGCPEMVNALVPYAGTDLGLEDYMILGTVSGKPETFRQLKLDTVLNRVAFRKRQRTSSPFSAHSDIIQILGVESFYSQAELHKLNPIRGLLWRLVLALEDAAEQSTVETEYAENLTAIRYLLESTEPMTSIIVRLRAYLKALSPYAPVTMSEASFIYMSFMNKDQPTVWPSDLVAHFDRATFRRTLREMMEVEHHLPIITNLGVESLFGAREINVMKGAHLSDALGL